MKIIKLILIICIAFTFQGTTLAQNAPTSKDVKRELNKLISDMNTYQEQNLPETSENTFYQNLVEFIQKIFDIIFDFIYNFRYPILIILIIGLVAFIIYIFQKSNPYTRSEALFHLKNNKNYFEEVEGLTFQELYQKSVLYSNNNEYNQAILYLHLATIKFLLDSFIIDKDIEYTNNDIKKILRRKNGPVDSFGNIANYAEIAGFSDIKIKSEEYHNVKKHFKKDFLKTK